MIMGNVRRGGNSPVSVSVVILALGPAARADDRNDQTRGTLWMPGPDAYASRSWSVGSAGWWPACRSFA